MKPILSSISVLSILGCGYSLRPPVLIPYKSVASPIVSNSTVKAGLEDILLEELISCIKTESNLKIVPEKDAELIIECNITNYTRTPQTYTANQDVLTYQILITAAVTIKDRTAEDGTAIFTGELSGLTSYDIIEKTEDDGIRQAARKLSQNILKKITISW
ncbi:MAG: LptE family protein [candidate division WOR-3 bacterium]